MHLFQNTPHQPARTPFTPVVLQGVTGLRCLLSLLSKAPPKAAPPTPNPAPQAVVGQFQPMFAHGGHHCKPPPPSTPTSTNPCDNMDGRKPGGHRWKCAEGRRRGLVIPSSANLRGYPEGNILAWMYHIKYESSWPERNSMSMKELAEAAAYQRMKQLGDG